MKMKKTIVAFIVLVALLLNVAFAEVDSAETMQKKIRNRGTIILSAHSENGLDIFKSNSTAAGNSSKAVTDSKAAAPAAAAAAAPAKPAHRLKRKNTDPAPAAPAPANNSPAPSTNGSNPKSIFQEDKTEVPVICNKMSKTQLLGLAIHGPSYQKAWITASGTNAGTYNNLPFLDDKKLAAFYKSIATGVKIEDGQLKPEDAEAQSKELLATILFDDEKRTDIGWLEFWVYMCNDGNKPASSNEYMSEIESISKQVEGILTGKIKLPENNSTANATKGAAAKGAPAAAKPARLDRVSIKHL